MLFVVRFTDRPNSQKIHERNFTAHVSWLDKRRDSVPVARSLREESDSNPIGAFWVVKASNKSEASEVFKSDLFWTSGMRESVEVLHWSKAFPNDQALA